MRIDDWEDGESLACALSEFGGDTLGLVLPLELKTASHWRQSLFGLELLEWLRFSGKMPGGINLIPVLAASWQPLQDVLRQRFEPLIVSHGCLFTRLPEAMEKGNEKLSDFVRNVRGDELFTYRERQENLIRFALGRSDAAEALTHHELANDYFAAWRLWVGYLKAVEDATHRRTKSVNGANAIREMLKSTREITFSWQNELNRKIDSPYFRQFCLAKKSIRVAPYRPVESAADLVALHAEHGVSPNTRILFIDDEFDLGLAEVLLQILFGRPGDKKLEFTTNGPADEEWVYSEPAARRTRKIQGDDCWARMVCVKDTCAAALWLEHWGFADLFEPRRKKAPKITAHKTRSEWIDDWAKFMGVPAKNAESMDDVLGYSPNKNLDARHARPKPVNTLIILDLRLKRQKPDDESAFEKESVRFIDALTHQQAEIPILILTASRQINIYTEIIEGDRTMQARTFPIDWLMKEAPDAMFDEVKSSHPVHRLLDFIHISARFNKWYRPSIVWDYKRKVEYQVMRDSGYSEGCLNSVSQRADKYIEKLGDESFRDKNKRRKLLGSVIEDGGNYKFKIESRLVARRVAIWALLQTSNWAGQAPLWDADRFHQKLSCQAIRQPVKFPSDVLNFNTDLYLYTYLPVLLDGLLKEEYDWLEMQGWSKENEEFILGHLKKIREKENV